jgi:uncharacterized repeat protein (TIGR01451 family)
VNLTASAAVQVTAAACVAPPTIVPTTQQPIAVVQAVPTLPVVQPKPSSAAPVCLRPSLVARIVGPRSVVAGHQVTWRISVRNLGSQLARSVVLNNRIPSGFSLLRSSPRAGFGSGIARVRLPNLRPGQTATVRLTLHASRDIVGRRLQHARVVTGCGGTEAAVAPITVNAVAGAITPAVTG